MQSKFTHILTLFDSNFAFKVILGGENVMLRLKRKKLMLSQIEASRVLGINNTYLSLIENKKRVRLNKILSYKICLLYDISQEDLNIFLNSEI